MNRKSSALAAASGLTRIDDKTSIARLRISILLTATVAFALVHFPSAHAAPQPVVQRGYDHGVSGATLSETTLTHSNVAPGRFGLVFKLSVDTTITAQPLYVPNVLINNVAHNVLYVATRGDTVYAFDADKGGAPLWTRHLAALKMSNAVACPSGIFSTPVIDLVTKNLYAVTCTLENNTMVFRLQAIDITTGVPRARSGVVISGSYQSATFDASHQGQRVSLVLVGNNVVFGFAVHGQEGTSPFYDGWVMAYDKLTLAQTGIFAAQTSGNGGAGAWQSGRPPAVGGLGYVYVITGNAYGAGYDGVHNFSESVLRLDPAHGLKLVDWFTPSNWSALDAGDLDLSASGPMVVPGTSLLVGGGKTGVLYMLNTANLGKNTANDSGAVQKIQISPGWLMGGPVYWQRSPAGGGPLLYNWGTGDRLKAFAFNGSRFSTTPSAQGSIQAYAPGGILTLSANGETGGTGVLWALIPTNNNYELNLPQPGALYAFAADNVAIELWNSQMDATHDSFGILARFVPPLVANGRVYVATWSNQVAVYGLK
jgi:hypothetical protein